MPAVNRLSLAVAALVPFTVIACSGGDRPEAEEPAAAAAPVATNEVSIGATAESTPAAALPTTVSYEEAESTYYDRRYDEAADLFAVYTRNHPDNGWGYYMLGLSAWKAGDNATAEHAFDQALTFDPDHLKSLYNSSRVLLEEDRAEEALDRIELALDVAPDSAEGYRLLGRVYHELGQADSAIDAYREALVRDGRDVWSLNNLGLVLIQQGRFEDALGPLARAVQVRGNAPVFQNNLGIALEGTGHYAAAVEAFTRALEADSTYAKAAENLARVSTLVDTSAVDSVDLGAVAQTFRLQVEMWRESAMAPPVDSAADAAPAAMVDTLSDSVIVPDTVQVPVVESAPTVEPEW